MELRMNRRQKKRKIWPYPLIIFFVLIGGVGAYVFNVYRDIARVANNMHNTVETDMLRDIDVNLADNEPFSVLLLGTDTGALGRTGNGLPDSLMVVTVNPHQRSTMIVSIPRDTRTEIVGRGTFDKINHAHAFGGVEMTINTVQNFLDIPIDYYVKVDMGGMKDLVDALGGIEVENAFDFTFEGTHFPAGILHLNGEDALQYSRMRDYDPNGDFGRQERQRQVIETIIREAATFSTVTQYSNILDAIEDNMETNVTLGEIVSIAVGYQGVLDHVQQLQLLVGSGQRINGIYYQVMSEEEVNEASTLLRGHLELEVLELEEELQF